MILGIDEVGRGPWAGPLVVGAVVLPEGLEIVGLTDSKKLTEKRRTEFDQIIREKALGWGLGWVHAEEIDEVGLSSALRLATVRAVEAVEASYHEIIIDGTINFLKDTKKGSYVQTLPKADLLIPAVSAASIIAKVARDTYMKQQDELYSAYGFSSHVGYGTAKHRQALEEHGVTVLHRRSFAPIAKLLEGSNTSGARKQRLEHSIRSATTSAVGNRAERAVATWLEQKGFRIVERNWKTKWCEIDIVAEKAAVRYFLEVKYRSSENQGGGLAAITPKKLEKMTFAAELYNSRHVTKKDVRLAAIAVDARGEITLTQVS